MAKVLKQILSTIIKARDNDGNFVPVFPINTTNEVYTDIDNDVKLSTFLNGILKAKTVNSIDEMYTLTPSDVNVNDFIKIIDTNSYFIVKDTNNLNSKLGYMEIITEEKIGTANGLAQLDENGKLPLESVEPSIEFITYSR